MLTARLGPPRQPPFNEVTVIGRHRRSEDQAFLKGSVARMARNPSSFFAAEEASAVVDSARGLLLELFGGVPPVRRQGMDADGARHLGGAAEG